METPKVVIAIYDSTTARCLKPVGEYLRSEVDVEYLLLDELLPRSAMGTELADEDLQPNRHASNYVKSEYLQKLNEIERAHPIVSVMIQRLVEDNISPELTYDLSGYLADSNPDVFVCGHDTLPFLKHIIRYSHDREFKTAVVQHGINRPDLENPSSLPGIPDPLSPDLDPTNWTVELIKRRIGFDHGAFLFCNPYVDELYTLGQFFTNLIGDLRKNYPCFGKTKLITAGSTEFNPTTITPYKPNISSGLFLSQWQYECDLWNSTQQSYIVDRLKQIEDESGIRITVRPHPKDSPEKIDQYFSDFDISTDSDIRTDIDAHDAILTVDSTALYLGAIKRKLCGIIQTPWDEITFLPFTHEHILEITGPVNLHAVAQERSVTTQKSYLTDCCFVPAIATDSEYTSPVELVSKRIQRLATA